ncbi:MAG: hypothetical protein NT166_06700 [Candidatus Aminicenantes bacterium]|nr:hypothetical protein [Candidatus Aminicenantes bacterium]
MTEITFKLTDDLVKQYGEFFIKKFFEKQMEYLSQLHSLNKIEEQINAANLDYDKELEKVRETAWQEYKQDFFN